MATRWLALGVVGLVVLASATIHPRAAGILQQPSDTPPVTASNSPVRPVVDRYCVRCHSDRLKTGGLSLAAPGIWDVETNAEVWEQAVRKLRARAMPPAGSPRPDEATYASVVAALEERLDRAAKLHPDPGRTDPFRRLNRTEYQNAIRDLLDLDVDVADLLPRDDAGFGFDNVSVAGLSPTLMERYLSAAQKISRLAVGAPFRTPASRVVVLPPDLTQETYFDGMPFGTRGGVAVDHTFPLDGEYTIQVQLSRDRNENVEGLTEPHQIEITIDGERLRVFTVTPNRNRLGSYYADENVDKGLEVRVPVKAGPHVVGASFLAKNSALIETERQPYQAHFNMDRHPRVQPALRSVSIAGPFDPTGVGDTPSRRRIFMCQPGGSERTRPTSDTPAGRVLLDSASEDRCARTILASLARRAYRRPATDTDLKPLLGFYNTARKDGGAFETGIEMALRALLSSPEFLFRIERDPAGVAPGSAYRLSDLALASRLSFFLWSSLPDDQLLTAAERGVLHEPATLERQVRRMLADPRAEALTTNFADQWLYLRNLASVTPDARLFPDFDDNLRRTFRRETQLLFTQIVSANRPVTELLTADYTFLNERLAKHYGIPNVYGDHFRRVSMADHPERVGLLGHGSILTVTSYATRTSPVLRGKWILDNILGMPPPPPPPNVPALKETRTEGRQLSMRQRMAEHRVNPACATCHQLMDPAGLSLENFDAIGRWRLRGEDGAPINASGGLPGGAAFEGVTGMREALTARPDVFVGTMTEKLLTFALGRGVDHHDAPAVRDIVRNAARDDYRFSSMILGVVESAPFQMRRAERRGAEGAPRAERAGAGRGAPRD